MQKHSLREVGVHILVPGITSSKTIGKYEDTNKSCAFRCAEEVHDVGELHFLIGVITSTSCLVVFGFNASIAEKEDGERGVS